MLDQVEEMFTRPIHDPEKELSELTSIIQELFGSPHPEILGKLLLSYRKEYHSDMEKAFESVGIPFTKTFIDKLDKGGIKEAISGVSLDPVLRQHFNLEIDPDLPDIIADDLQDDQVAALAPALQILLDKMWQDSDADQPHFTVSQYRRLKSQGILLSDFLTNQVQAVRNWNASIVDNGLIYDILYFFTTPFGTANIHTYEDTIDRYRDQEAIVRPLIPTFRRGLSII